MVGRSLLHYRITEKLGEGGMGVVYKAEDTQLRRTVALKFLSRETLGEDEVKERLIREAQAAASLDHPNICQVFGIHEEDGETFIAMAYVDGPSLAEKIKERPLPLDESLSIAAQIAEGLNEAHEQGVVHRDVKPHNVMLTSKGQVKIMDFGLASLAGRSKLTKSGTTLGTPAYMSPEQLEGKKVDRRADVWALGCVLYEMLTQKTPFEADYEQAIGYGILNEDPEPVTALRRGLPPKVDDILAKALAKDRDERYQHADDLLADLRVLQKRSGERKTESGRSRTAAAARTLQPTEALPPDAVVVKRSSQRLLQAVAVVATLAMLIIAFFQFTEAQPEVRELTTTRFSFAPEGLSLARISPDGRYIAFTAQADSESSLWLRAIGSETAREIPGTDVARPQLGWSPDSQSIVFATTTQIKRVSIAGGDPITLGDLPGAGRGAFGVSWSPDGERLVFATLGDLYEVAARGGQPQLLLDLSGDSTRSAAFPHFLPTGSGPSGLVFTARGRLAYDRWLAVLNLETGEWRELGPGTMPVYSLDGYLIHGSDTWNEVGLFSLPFSLATLKPTGKSFPIAAEGQGPTVARNGTLAYLDDAGGAAGRTLIWRNRAGELIETIGQPQPGIEDPALSPDGQRIAMVSPESGNRDIWVHDLIRSTKTRVTFDEGAEAAPTWSPSGEDITYFKIGSRFSIRSKAADGTGEAVALVESELVLYSSDWSRDGRYLVYQENRHLGGGRGHPLPGVWTGRRGW